MKLDDIQLKLQKSGPTVIALGNFDGVHIGHQAIFQKVVEIAKKDDLASAALILYPHPKEIFTGSSPALLTTLEDRKKLIHERGVQEVLDLTFNQELSEWTSEKILKYFRDCLNMKHLVLGPTTHMGKNREGTPERIAELAKKFGFEATIVARQSMEGSFVSSSMIREQISRGKVKEATTLLNRYYVTHGVVETGMGKGREFGFPTANIGNIPTMVPASGIYAGYTTLDGKRYKTAISVGTRPTVTSSKELVVEAYLIDFNEKIVGKSLSVEWVDWIRDEVKFSSIKELTIQIQKDVCKVKDSL